MCIRDRHTSIKVWKYAYCSLIGIHSQKTNTNLLCTITPALLSIWNESFIQIYYIVLYQDISLHLYTVIQLSFNISGHFIAYEQFSFDLL